MSRDASHANGTPITTPIPTIRSARINTDPVTRDGRAPNARRMPISRVRVATPNDISPYKPTAASPRASAPKIELRITSSRSSNKWLSICAASVRMRSGAAGTCG